MNINLTKGQQTARESFHPLTHERVVNGEGDRYKQGNWRGFRPAESIIAHFILHFSSIYQQILTKKLAARTHQTLMHWLMLILVHLCVFLLYAAATSTFWNLFHWPCFAGSTSSATNGKFSKIQKNSFSFRKFQIMCHMCMVFLTFVIGNLSWYPSMWSANNHMSTEQQKRVHHEINV